MTDARRPPSAPFDAAPDDFEHPQYEQLMSLVDDRLDEVDREWIVGHIEVCEVCKEDVDDLIHVRSSLVPQTAVKLPVPVEMPDGRRWIKQAIGLSAVAAGVALAFWIVSRGPSHEVVAPVIPNASAPSPSPNPPTPTVTAARTLPPSVLTEEESARVARALESGRLELPANMAVLRGHTGTLLGDTAAPISFSPTTPIGTAISEPRPRFAWTEKTGATRYSVKIFDERFREVAKSGLLKGTTWTPARDLPRGRVLAWQISAVTKEGTTISPVPPQPEARFIVLDAATVTAMAKQRTRLATEPIALGLALAKTGLFAEAEAVLERALTDERYDRTQVRALITRLRAR